jgi:hypothetical protein
MCSTSPVFVCVRARVCVCVSVCACACVSACGRRPSTPFCFCLLPLSLHIRFVSRTSTSALRPLIHRTAPFVLRSCVPVSHAADWGAQRSWATHTQPLSSLGDVIIVRCTRRSCISSPHTSSSSFGFSFSIRPVPAPGRVSLCNSSRLFWLQTRDGVESNFVPHWPSDGLYSCCFVEV